MNERIDLDENLLLRLQEGNVKAFSCLFDFYNSLLFALAYRYLKSKEDAEDAVQYTFMKIWEERERLSFTGGTRSLLFTILKNYIMNELRHQQIVLVKHVELKNESEESKDDLFEGIAKKDIYQHLQQAIDNLPPQKREICRLKLETDLTNQQIADKMNISIDTVKSHYTQALKTLNRMMGSLGLWIIIIFLIM